MDDESGSSPDGAVDVLCGGVEDVKLSPSIAQTLSSSEDDETDDTDSSDEELTSSSDDSASSYSSDEELTSSSDDSASSYSSDEELTSSSDDSASSSLSEPDIVPATITVMNWNAKIGGRVKDCRKSEANMVMDLKPSIYCRQEVKKRPPKFSKKCRKSSDSDPWSELYGHHTHGEQVGISYLLSQFKKDKTTELDDKLNLKDAMKQRVTCIQLEADSGQQILVASVHERTKTNNTSGQQSTESADQTSGQRSTEPADNTSAKSLPVGTPTRPAGKQHSDSAKSTPKQIKKETCDTIIACLISLADDNDVPLVIGGDWNSPVTELKVPKDQLYSADRAATRRHGSRRKEIDAIVFYVPDGCKTPEIAVKAEVKNCFVIEPNWWTMRWYKEARQLHTNRGGGHVPQLVAITSSKHKEDYPKILKVFKAIGGKELKEEKAATSK